MKKAVQYVRFHGMIVISDQDCVTVKDNYVVELSSSGKLICRYYDKNGVEDDEFIEIDLFNTLTKDSCTESNLTGSIKRQVGKNSLLISESAIRYIKKML